MVRDELRNLKYIFDNSGAIGQKRKDIANYIISVCKDSDNPYDALAAAVAYQWKGAAFRNESIGYYEQFIDSGARLIYYSKWEFYSTLAELYEAEYNYEQAIRCLCKCQKASNYTNPADFTRIGDIALKISVDEAVVYYERLRKSPHYEQHKSFFEAKYADVLEKKRRGYVYRPRNKAAVEDVPSDPEDISDDTFDDDWDNADALSEFDDLDFDDSEWDEFILEHEQPAPRKNVSVAPAAPLAAQKKAPSLEASTPFTGWDDTDSPDNKQISNSVGNGDVPMPSCGGCLVYLLLPPIGILRVWANDKLSAKNKINATAILCLWICIILFASVLSCNSYEPGKNSSYSSSKTTTTTRTTQSTKPTEPLVSLPELLEIESPLGNTTGFVYDVLNGSKTEVIGRRGYIQMYKETLLNASDEDIVEFVNSAASLDLNWVTIDFDDGTGIVISGSVPDIIDYGQLSDDGKVETVYGYAVLRDGKYKYTPTDVTTTAGPVDIEPIIVSPDPADDVTVDRQVTTTSAPPKPNSNTTKPNTAPAQNGTMVWISENGKKYHRRAGCSGMTDPWEVTKDKAESLGYTPCKRCY